jgi:hypothetical protein
LSFNVLNIDRIESKLQSIAIESGNYCSAS